MTDSQEPPSIPPANPPGWTDPYSDLNDLSGNEPLPPMEPPTTPPAQPPGSPLLTGLIIGLLLVALSVAVFQLLSSDDAGTAGDTTTTTAGDSTESTTTTAGDESTTTTTPDETTSSLPNGDPYDPVLPAYTVSQLKMITNGMRINDDEVSDLQFGDDADMAIGRLVASFGDPTEDTGWQVSTGQFGVCATDVERILTFGLYAAIVTDNGEKEIYNGYRQDLNFASGDGSVGELLETLSGLKIGDTVADLKNLYSGEDVTFATDAKLDQIYEVHGSTSGNLLLWGPIEGVDDGDRIIGIYAPDVCGR